jgi:hypothetical protein
MTASRISGLIGVTSFAGMTLLALLQTLGG